MLKTCIIWYGSLQKTTNLPPSLTTEKALALSLPFFCQMCKMSLKNQYLVFNQNPSLSLVWLAHKFLFSHFCIFKGSFHFHFQYTLSHFHFGIYTSHLRSLSPHLTFLPSLSGSCKIFGFLSFFIFSNLNARKIQFILFYTLNML